ncbi:MAG: plastocyanin/azurin family copper-binding protein [Gammaproteobacteria bacterium]
MKTSKYSAFAALVLFSSVAFCEEHVVDQIDKEFSETEITIKVGDEVHFKNEDRFFHNVFSLSDIKTFDLGSYPKGEQRSVKFDAAGEVKIECAIHPDMQMTIKVEE